MESEPKKLKPAEKKIARLLFKYRIPMSKYKIADETGYSWPTISTHVDNLLERGVLKETDDGEYEFDRSIFKDPKKRKSLK